MALLSAHSAAVRCPLAAQGPARAAQSRLCIRTCPTCRGPSSSSCSTHLFLGTCSLHSDGVTGRTSPPAASCSRCWRRTGCPWGVCVRIPGGLCPVFVRAPVALCVRPCACVGPVSVPTPVSMPCACASSPSLLSQRQVPRVCGGAVPSSGCQHHGGDGGAGYHGGTHEVVVVGGACTPNRTFPLPIHRLHDTLMHT
jgi:hypothetical protein